MPKICSKLRFERLLLKLATENNSIKRCSDADISKRESEVVNLSKLNFCKRFIDDIIHRRNKIQSNELFEKLSKNHPKMNYVIEIKSAKCF